MKIQIMYRHQPRQIVLPSPAARRQCWFPPYEEHVKIQYRGGCYCYPPYHLRGAYPCGKPLRRNYLSFRLVRKQ